ncbi:hypothetical protein SMACR_01878 [Sordaria macrospora]|uniref:WGS project CABT00000000 data, contig 2.5 n=2 Tax=Sordaria macrospora TaxID=5147 RepID=F7VS45_SORMK|nr:uncharacterized protein SMAC_01878 [Sordaria macrospora k-hell]KAA8634041.1 hypothetical protein SMACR_01878 [Sordaria macrospora]KAH7631803.1 hypothetical protein B0T09DRAFT_356308 [Sordaria sp. MPI-SDFR-AT-0083]WPJ63113.1 hypothetical protein SMAC4_01878 [Sordaria macrospora]CCC08331.1 unnamed protein product [Sordaria macrospora k-hell]
MSDTGDLADSVYEMVGNYPEFSSQDSPFGSPDDDLSESISSLPPHPSDDVRSLDGSEDRFTTESDEEREEEDEPTDTDGAEELSSSRASSIKYTDQALQSPSTNVPANPLQYGSVTSIPDTSKSIEFQEAATDTVDSSPVFVRHAIKELTGKEANALSKSLDLSEPPQSLSVSLRQTMSQACLSTDEPLRVLYTGSAAAQRDILLKVSSAIWVSPKDGHQEDGQFMRHREGVYNIVPISSFGSAPELDLMEASSYQIKVEHCTSATASPVGDGPVHGPNTVYSVTIEHERTYTSLPSHFGAANLDPHWDIPHLAVFYCSENVDEEDQRTREAAWGFTKRHGIPSIFISEHLRIEKQAVAYWSKYLNKHAIHISLESSDPTKTMAPRLLPVDLESFGNINAWQMNRNIAYLTGLSDTKGSEKHHESGTKVNKWWQNLTPSRMSRARVVEAIERKGWLFTLLLPLFAALLSQVFLGYLGPLPAEQIQPLRASQASAMMETTPVIPSTVSVKITHTSTATVVVNITSTKTIHATPSTKPSVSSLASALSYAGLLLDRPSDTPAEVQPQKTVCSVRVNSPNELLVVIPSSSKAMWLAKGAIDIDVYQGEKRLNTKLSSVDEGILVELPGKQAQGRFNVSVISNRRPKTNETFEVDFGTDPITEAFEASKLLLQDFTNVLSAAKKEVVHIGSSRISETRDAARNTYKKVAKKMGSTVSSKDIVRLKKKMDQGVYQLEVSVVKAQIKSKLVWLKLRGSPEEYKEYLANATRFLQEFEAMRQEKTEEAQEEAVSDEPSGFLGRLRHRLKEKDQSSQGRNKGTDMLWRMMA